MYHTICQKCGASNREDAVVCIQCGTKLAHPERRAWARLRASGVPQMFLMAPVRFGKWLFIKAKTLVLALLFLLVLGGLLLFFLLFVPFSWPDYPMPQPVPENDAELKNQLMVLREKGGTIACDPERMRQLGNILIFGPARGKPRPGAKKGEAAPAAPDRNKGYFSALKEGDNHFIFVLYMRLYDKLPMRLAAKFEAARDQEGKLLLESCRVGNLPVSCPLLRRAAEKMLASWNPGQRFLTVIDRIEQGNMVLRSGAREDTLTLKVRPAPRDR